MIGCIKNMLREQDRNKARARKEKNKVRVQGRLRLRVPREVAWRAGGKMKNYKTA